MGNPSDLSIVAIIALYNGAKFIEEAIRSVLSQTLQPAEFLVVDDGSTDDGPALVERLAQDHPIRLLRKPNGGQSSARNFGASHSHSPYIAFLDQDDIWYPHHLERLSEPFRQRRGVPLGWVYSNLDEVDEQGGVVTKNFLDTVPVEHPKKTLVNCLGQDMFILPSASLISREAFDAVGGFDERLSGFEDDDLFLRIFRASYDNVYIDEPLSQWRIFAGSTSYSPLMARSRMVYALKLIEMFPGNPARDRHYARDVTAPRFLDAAIQFYRQAQVQGDTTAQNGYLSNMWTLLPHTPEYAATRIFPLLMERYHHARANGDIPAALADLDRIISYLPPDQQARFRRTRRILANPWLAGMALKARGIVRAIRRR